MIRHFYAASDNLKNSFLYELESFSQTALCLHKIYKNVYGIGAIIFRDCSVMSLLCCYFVNILMSRQTTHSFT